MLSRYLEVVTGDTLSFRIVLRDGSSPVDISGFTFSGGVRQAGTKINIANFGFEVIGGPIGVVRVTLTPSQTEILRPSPILYEWNVKASTADYVKTLGRGALKVLAA